jgi:hypothetical protein
MPQQYERARRGLQVERDVPLIGIFVPPGNPDVVEYFVDEEAVDEPVSPASVEIALSLLGAWQDIDCADALDELDRIRQPGTHR